MSIPITFQNECYFIVDKATLSTVNVLFVGNVLSAADSIKNTLVSTENFWWRSSKSLWITCG